jgi:hypothetical protein
MELMKYRLEMAKEDAEEQYRRAVEFQQLIETYLKRKLS